MLVRHIGKRSVNPMATRNFITISKIQWNDFKAKIRQFPSNYKQSWKKFSNEYTFVFGTWIYGIPIASTLNAVLCAQLAVVAYWEYYGQ